jgi:hypothetical protein
MLRNYDGYPNAKMPTATAVQMRNTATLCYEFMSVLRACWDNEVKVTVKSF